MQGLSDLIGSAIETYRAIRLKDLDAEMVRAQVLAGWVPSTTTEPGTTGFNVPSLVPGGLSNTTLLLLAGGLAAFLLLRRGG